MSLPSESYVFNGGNGLDSLSIILAEQDIEWLSAQGTLDSFLDYTQNPLSQAYQLELEGGSIVFSEFENIQLSNDINSGPLSLITYNDQFTSSNGKKDSFKYAGKSEVAGISQVWFDVRDHARTDKQGNYDDTKSQGFLSFDPLTGLGSGGRFVIGSGIGRGIANYDNLTEMNQAGYDYVLSAEITPETIDIDGGRYYVAADYEEIFETFSGKGPLDYAFIDSNDNLITGKKSFNPFNNGKELDIIPFLETELV